MREYDKRDKNAQYSEDTKGNRIYKDLTGVRLYKLKYRNRHGEWTLNVISHTVQNIIDMLVDRFGEVTILELDKMGTEIHSIVPEVEFIIAEKNFNRVLKARKISKEMEKKLESGKVNVKDFLNPNSTVEKGDLLKPTATQPRTIVSAILNRRKP